MGVYEPEFDLIKYVLNEEHEADTRRNYNIITVNMVIRAKYCNYGQFRLYTHPMTSVYWLRSQASLLTSETFYSMNAAINSAP